VVKAPFVAAESVDMFRLVGPLYRIERQGSWPLPLLDGPLFVERAYGDR
jgi:hypothetical protein